MNRLTKWAIRRIVMKRLKGFFSGLVDYKASEFWTGWSGILLKALCMANGTACVAINQAAEFIGFGSAEVMVAVLLTIAASRMQKKMVAVPAGPAVEEKL